MEKRCSSRQRKIHMELVSKTRSGCRRKKQIPVAIQPLVKMVWLIQDLWSCSSFDLRTLNTRIDGDRHERLTDNLHQYMLAV